MSITIPTIEMNDGGRIPAIGSGTLFLKGNELANRLADALRFGFRLLDTASQYANEGSVGQAIKRSGVNREEVFLTTKIAGMDQGKGLTRHALEESLRKLDTDYVDLLLIHWPNPSRGLYVETWEEMLALREEGLVKHVGVSNFLPHHLNDLYEATGVWPVVDQIQMSPALARTKLREFLSDKGIIPEAWRPLGGPEQVSDQIIVKKIARAHEVDVSQVILKWSLQVGAIVIPSSKSPERWKINTDLFGFELSDEEMSDLATLDWGEEAARDSDVHEEW